MREASPFLAMLCYQSAVANLRIYREKRTQESLDDFTEIKAGVKEFDWRWKAAGRSSLRLTLARLTFDRCILENFGGKRSFINDPNKFKIMIS